MKKKLLGIVKRTLSIYTNKHISIYAGNATLFVLTAIFPLIVLVIAIVNLIPGYSPDDFAELFFRFLPDVEELRTVTARIFNTLKNQSSGALAGVAALTTIWASSSGVSAIQKGLQRIFPGAIKDIKDRPLAVLYTLVFIILLPLTTIFQTAGDLIIKAVNNLSEKLGLAQVNSILSSIIELSHIINLILSVFMVLLIYRYLPRGRRSFKSQLPGAIFTGLSWMAFKEIFSFAIPRFWIASSIYGSLAVLFLGILWLHILMSLLFLGACLNVAIRLENESRHEGGISKNQNKA